ncbi:MAG: hypothetical protein K2I70_00400 [Bacilli bacterium]|nr:hypothetical protein [Bacilli bacterium]
MVNFKVFVLLMLTALVQIIFIPIVYATDRYNCENISDEKYQKLINIYSKEFIDNLDEKEYNLIVNSDLSNISVKYINDKVYSTYSLVHETTYKQLKIINNNGYVTLMLSWKQQPKIRSYDVIGVRYDSGCSLDSFSFKQIYVKDNTSHVSKNGEYKLATNGLGLTFKVETGSVVTSTLSFSVKGSCRMYGSYQHAQASLSLKDAKDYQISSSGLGRVFKFSKSEISNKYDAMTGVDITI